MMCHDVPYLGVNMQGWLVPVLEFRAQRDQRSAVALIVRESDAYAHVTFPT